MTRPRPSEMLRIVALPVVFGVIIAGSAVPSLASEKEDEALALTAQDLVNIVPQTVNLAGADDLLAELNALGRMIAADGQHYTPGVNLHNGSQGHFLYTYGRSLFAVAQMLPFLDGDLSNPATIKGGVAAYLKAEIQTYMLDDAYYDMETVGSVGYRQAPRTYRAWAPAVLRPGEEALDENPWWGPNPSWTWGGWGYPVSALPWGGGFLSLDPAEHSRWEGLLAIWAYAHHTGDWSFISSNWTTLKAIRASAPANPTKPTDYHLRGTSASNAWIGGLVAFARMARAVGDSAAESSAISALSNALNSRAGEGIGGRPDFTYRDSGSIWSIHGWDEWTPEFAHWLRDRFGAQAIADQVNLLVNDDDIYLWYESDMSHAHGGENTLQASWISYPIYHAMAASMASVDSGGNWTYSPEARALLRDRLPQVVVSRVTPYHRDAYYLQNLVALVRAHGTTSWLAAGASTLGADSASAGPGAVSVTANADVANVAFLGRTEVVHSVAEIGSDQAAQAAGPDQWPQFMHDPQRSGFSRDGVTGHSAGGLRLVWKKNLGLSTHGRAQPVVVDGAIYQGFLEGRFLALDAATGNTRWSFQSDGPITGSAAVANGRVYFGSWDGRVYCRDAATGAEIWTFDTEDLGSTPPVMRGRIKASILQVGDTVYVGASNRRFYAIDAATGRLRWRYQATANIEGAAAFSGGRILFMTEVGYDSDFPPDRRVAMAGIALNATDGSLAWKLPLPGEKAGASYPVVAGHYVLFVGDAPEMTNYGGGWQTNAWEYFSDNSYVSRYGVDGTLRLSAEARHYFPQRRTSTVVDIRTGQERLFTIPGMAQPQPLPLGIVYDNWVSPIAYQGRFLVGLWWGLWVVDPEAGTISYRFDRNVWSEPRWEEQMQFVGGEDYLIFSGEGGKIDLIDLSVPDGNPVNLLDGPTYGHFPDTWLDPPSTQISYLPGQGNGYVEASGYAIPVNGRLYVAAVPGWFYAFEGTYVQGSPPEPEPTFVDVPFDHPYHDVIEVLYQAGYTAGCNTDPLMYCPEATMNRAESAVFVERGIHGTDGLPPPQPTTQTFADLPLDSWAAKWAEALWQDHYTAGCGTGPLIYCPWQGHTRAEGCVFYLHMLNGPTYQPPQPSQQTFADVPLETWYAKWVQAGYDAGLLEPCQTSPELRFCPDAPLSRGLAAYMMVQAKGLGEPPPTAASCLSQPGPLIAPAGTTSQRFDERELAESTKVDAIKAHFLDAGDYPVVLRGGANLCFSGGFIEGTYPPTTSWDAMHGTTAMEISNEDFTVELTRVHDYGDGISVKPGARFFTVRGVHFSYMRDDCIENDWMYAGLVEDALMDGCYSAFSARPEASGVDGRSNLWTIRNSLIRLQPMEAVYQNRGTIPGHDGWFKWDNSSDHLSPMLSLHSNVFRADQDANNVGLGIPEGKLASCSNNIMVWLGSGPYPDPLPDCFSITTDESVWDRAVADWLLRHPSQAGPGTE